jgi:hypothetical protein
LFAAFLFFLGTIVGIAPSWAQEEGEDKPPEPVQAQEMKPEDPEPAETPAPAAGQAVTPEQRAEAAAHPAGPHHPPRTGKMVGDHWTPYEPPDPESFPPGSQVHIIEPGDTLWDLSARFLTNAYLWPQLWDVNQYITDSHWIYPGDPLLVPGAPTLIAEAPPAAPPPPPPAPAPEEPEAEPEEPAAPPLPPPPALVPVAVESDIYCSSYIEKDFQAPALFIAEREEGAKTVLSTGDIVFLSQGSRDGIAAGRYYSVAIPEHEVWHPVRKEDLLGTSVRTIGRVHVVAVQEASATAEIVGACDAIEVGSYLVPFEEVPVPLSSPVAFRTDDVEISGENPAYIVHVSDDKLSFGQGDMVNLDVGSADGVQPGDVFTVFREWGGTVEFGSARSYIEGQQLRAEEMRAEGEAPVYSYVLLGQVVAIGVKENTSTGKVLVAVREMSVGDRVELR